MWCVTSELDTFCEWRAADVLKSKVTMMPSLLRPSAYLFNSFISFFVALVVKWAKGPSGFCHHAFRDVLQLKDARVAEKTVKGCECLCCQAAGVTFKQTLLIYDYLSQKAGNTGRWETFLCLTPSQAGKTTCGDALQGVCNLKMPKATVSAFMRASVEIRLRLQGKDTEKAISIRK